MSIPAIEPTTAQVTAAFARVTDARYAIDILERCGVEPVDIAIDTVHGADGRVQLVIMRVEIAGVARDRILAAISGGHGVPMADSAEPVRPARVA